MAAVLLLAKAPEPGKVKTRMSPPLSATLASCLHEAMLKDTLQLLRSQSSARYLAYSGSRAWFDLYCPDFYLFAQQGEDLAARLHYSFSFLLSWQSPVLCLGSDSPHLPPAYLRQAWQLLESHEVVLGPALDGGYYLIGLQRFQPLFLGMPMSTPGLLTATRNRCQTLGLVWAELPPLGDFDTWEDVEAYRELLPLGETSQFLGELSAQR